MSSTRQRKGKKKAPAAAAGPSEAADATKVEPKKRIYVVDGPSTDKPKPQGFLSSLTAGLTLFLFGISGHLSTFILPVACLITRNNVVIGVTVALWLTVLLPATRHWDAFLASYVMKAWREYHSFSFVCLEPLDDTRRYVFGESPHGVFPLGPVLAGTVVHLCFPGLKVQAISASNVFRVPLLKHFMSWLGAAPATRGNFRMMLQKDSVAVVIGGAPAALRRAPRPPARR